MRGPNKPSARISRNNLRRQPLRKEGQLDIKHSNSPKEERKGKEKEEEVGKQKI